MTARSRRNDMAAQAAAVMAGGQQQEQRAPEPAAVDEQHAAATRATPRVKPVRMVVELQPIEHRRLKRLADDFAERLELTSVAMSEVARVLFEMVQRDPELAERVAAELGKTGGTRRR